MIYFFTCRIVAAFLGRDFFACVRGCGSGGEVRCDTLEHGKNKSERRKWLTRVFASFPWRWVEMSRKSVLRKMAELGEEVQKKRYREMRTPGKF